MNRKECVSALGAGGGAREREKQFHKLTKKTSSRQFKGEITNSIRFCKSLQHSLYFKKEAFLNRKV